MKEDILEQLIEDWYVTNPGWFVKHNVKYRPSNSHFEFNSKKDSVNSDIDIIAYSALKRRPNNVHVISCKSWQGGLNIKNLCSVLENEAEYNAVERDKFQKREDWKKFRELVSDKWIESFINTIEKETGQRDFTYKIAVTKIIGDESFIKYFSDMEIIKKRFKKYSSNIILEIIDLRTIIIQTIDRLNNKETPAVEMTDIGRLLQLLNAANMEIRL